MNSLEIGLTIGIFIILLAVLAYLTRVMRSRINFTTLYSYLYNTSLNLPVASSIDDFYTELTNSMVWFYNANGLYAVEGKDVLRLMKAPEKIKENAKEKIKWNEIKEVRVGDVKERQLRVFGRITKYEEGNVTLTLNNGEIREIRGVIDPIKKVEAIRRKINK